MQSSKTLLPFLSRTAIHTLALILAMMLARHALGQSCEQRPVTVSPSNPTSRTPIVLSFRGYLEGGCSTLSYRIEGSVIAVENIWDCATGAAYGPRQVSIGLLPPGSYYVQVYDADFYVIPPIACGTFTVAAAPPEVPSLTPSLLAALAVCVAMTGVLVLRRL